VTAQTKASGGHRPALDVIRGLAALAVLLHHVDAAGDLGGGVFDGFGIVGVSTFFVLSGYLLYRPYVTGPVDLRSYAVRRAARVLPAYLFALVGLTLVTHDRSFLDHPLSYLLFIQNFDPSLFQGFLGVAWTLEMEVWFYLGLPVIAWLVRGNEVRRLIVLGGGSLIAWTALWGGGARVGLVTLVPLYVWMFVPGMLLAAVQAQRPAFLRTLARPILGIALIIAGAALAEPLGRFGSGLQGAAIYVLVLAGASAVVATALTRSLTSRVAALAWFGSALSYPVYLWHATFVWALAGLGLAGVALLGAAFLVTVPVAAISWFAFERPIFRLAHRYRARVFRDNRDDRLAEAPAPIPA
jgi:peptidoglycan/LPS O-acetylase OafA/YrhL